MNLNLITPFIISGIADSGIDFSVIATSISDSDDPQRYLQLLEQERESDVYVNNYFEQVVPFYANQTYRSHFRMTRQTMAVLINELKSFFESQEMNVHAMIVPLEKKVHVTVWMLANYAVTFRECGTLFGMSTGTVHFVFMQICSALSLLQNKFIKWPSLEKCRAMAAVTFEKTSFPGIIGALDGCHIEIKAPAHNSFDYYNRKQFHSVILQGTCDLDLKFVDVFIGVPGRVHDARVFRLSALHQQIRTGLIPHNLHILADSAYSLHENVLTPFRDNGHLRREQTRYNKKHSAIRSSIERCFGLLKNKFRRLRYLDMSLTNEIPIIIAACCVLHNIILDNEGYEEGEDYIDGLDEIQVIDVNEPADVGDGVNKRLNIARLL